MSFADAFKDHPAIAGAIGGATIGALAIAGAGAINRRRKKTKANSRRKTSSKRTRACPHKKRARRSNKRSPKKIRHTKNGQPYIILPNGRARFISKRSESSRKQRKGGYY